MNAQTDADFVVVSTDVSDGAAAFNSDLSRFAIPQAAFGGDGEHLRATVNEVNAAIGAYRDGDASAKEEALLHLLSLHTERRVLWPVTAIYGGSVLGPVSTRQFVPVFQDHDPGFSDHWATMRDRVASTRSRQTKLGKTEGADTKAGEREDREWTDKVASAWRFAVALRCATSAPIDALEDIDSTLVESAMEILRPSAGGGIGKWIEVFSTPHVRRAPRILVEYLRDELHMEEFTPNFMKWFEAIPRTARPGYKYPEYLKKWVGLYEEWIDSQHVITKTGHRCGLRMFCDYYRTRPSVIAVSRDTLFDGASMEGLLKFARTWSTPSQRISAISYFYHFMQWLVHRSSESRIREDEEPLLCYLKWGDVTDFMREQNANLPSRNGDVAARGMNTRLHLMLRDIIAEDDFAWPKTLDSKAYGASKYSARVKNPVTGLFEDVFCPVIPRLLLLLLDLPLRGVQARRLDSGEGDARRYDHRSGTWRDNGSEHAGYWIAAGATNSRRGAIREIATADGKKITGFWINSNKTQDRGNLFDDTSGYEMPWEHSDALENLSLMREWQEKYNPVEGPLAHKDIPSGIFEDEPSKAVRAKLPARFYLFRLPGRQHPPRPSALNDFFLMALAEMEERLNKEIVDPDEKVSLIRTRDSADRPSSAIYSLHGLRSGTITSLYLQGVGIEVLSKLVAGHASILMTLKYTKFDPAHVSEMLEGARLKAASEDWAKMPKVLSRAAMDEVMRMTASFSKDALDQLKGSYSEQSAWSRLDIGICPNGATQCSVGGEAVRQVKGARKDKSLHSPVPGGPRNCVRCRFFVTGLAFLIPLWASANATMARADALAHDSAKREKDLRGLKAEKCRLFAAGEPVPPSLSDKIVREDAAATHVMEASRDAFEDLHATLAMIEKVRAIAQRAPADGEPDGLPMVIDAEEAPDIVARESTRFEVVDAVVQCSRVFPSLRSDDLERERDEFLDRVLYENGYVPLTMSKLSLEEKHKAADAMAKLLLIRIGAQEAQLLGEGRKTLTDFGLQQPLEDACMLAIGSPLPRIARPAAAPLLIELAAE